MYQKKKFMVLNALIRKCTYMFSYTTMKQVFFYRLKCFHIFFFYFKFFDIITGENVKCTKEEMPVLVLPLNFDCCYKYSSTEKC